MWKQAIKETAPWVMPGVRLGRWAKNQISYPVVASSIELRAAGRIMSGPFKDLRAPGSGTGGAGYYAELLGIYETSLVPVIESVIARAPKTIVDAGSNWGYYALGLAMRCPNSKIIAYEIDTVRANLLRKYRSRNDLEGRVEVRGACTVDALERDLAEPADSFLLMDVEGAEDVLLDPSQAPALRKTEILVELHDQFVPGVTRTLQKRFADTHVQELLFVEHTSVGAALLGWVAESAVSRPVVARMMDEGREADMAWLHLSPSG
jgi:hypothetical protein